MTGGRERRTAVRRRNNDLKSVTGISLSYCRRKKKGSLMGINRARSILGANQGVMSDTKRFEDHLEQDSDGEKNTQRAFWREKRAFDSNSII
jgi:hypothetical protein